MKLFTLKELGKMNESSHQTSDVSEYAKELSDGWRTWLTLWVKIIPFAILVNAILFPWQWVALISFCFIAAPVVMTLGFLVGAVARNFPANEALRLARSQAEIWLKD